MKPSIQYRLLGAPALLAALSACMPPPATQSDFDTIGPLAVPAVDAAGSTTCFGSARTPALVETVTEQVLVVPETLNEDGSVAQVAVYRTVTRQNILRERGLIEFETPCADVMTPELIASVQRALAARGFYDGPITGQLDALTDAAILSFQTDQDDIQTSILTLRSARSLGLVPIPRDQL